MDAAVVRTKQPFYFRVQVGRWPAVTEAYRMLTGRARLKVIPWLPSVPPVESVKERVDALIGMSPAKNPTWLPKTLHTTLYLMP